MSIPSPDALSPRNGHVIVRLIKADADKILLPDGVSADRPGDQIVIVALAPDVAAMTEPQSNRKLYSVGDAIIGMPGGNIMSLADMDLGVIHYTAIVCIDRRQPATLVH